jgi:IS30 family transposase
MSNELTFYERQKLEFWLKHKISLRKIAAKLMIRDHSVISREIKRNANGNRKKYKADLAEKMSEKRKHVKHKGKLDKYPEVRDYVEQKLNDDWSPEQIAGVLKDELPSELKGLTVSHESIYYWIYEKAEKHKKLYKHLRNHRKKRKKQGKRKSVKIAIPERISIHERPEMINNRARYGDWESDTLEFRMGNKKRYLSVQYERKSQLARLHLMRNKTSEETRDAVIKTIESLPNELTLSFTFDNGSEGVKHTEVKDLFSHIETYFCDPFCSWQKGGVENMNKLIRQYLPKKTNMDNITKKDIYEIQERINNRPRKSLKYLTPNKIIQKVVH